MIIQVPIVYKVQACLGRKRNTDTLTVAETAPCALREVAGADAPVVMWWALDQFGPQECVRWHEGKFYAPIHLPQDHGRGRQAGGLESPADGSVGRRIDPHGVAEEDADEAAEPADAEEGAPADPGHGYLVTTASFAAALAEGSARISGRTAHVGAPDKAEHRLDALPIRKVVSTNLDAVRAGIAGAIGGLLSVDGVLFREVPRPVYVLRIGHRGSGFEIHAAFDDERTAQHEHAYQPDEYGAMRDAWLASRKDRDGATLPEVAPTSYAWGNLPGPDIVRPDLLPRDDPAAYQLARTGRAIVEFLSAMHHDSWGTMRYGPYVARYDRPVILAFGRLRDALAAGAPAVEIAERLTRLAEACEGHGTLHVTEEAARFAVARAEAAYRDHDALALGGL